MRTLKFKATHPWPVLPADVLQVPPISRHGNVNEIIGKFGGAGQPGNAVTAPRFAGSMLAQDSLSL